MNTLKVCAIVVTYNRKNLLIKALNSIMSQTRLPEKIIIIDNASTDGTYNYLTLNNWFQQNKSMDVEYVRLDENTGGAGGFFYGLQKAFDQQFDYYWLMDDDGYSDSFCLSELLEHRSSYHFLSPLVIDCDDHSHLSFGIKGQSLIKQLGKIDKYIKDVANPFNGVLFSHQMVKIIGFPKKDMFIWGDENEYQSRAKKYGFEVATLSRAKHFHPRNRINKTNFLFNKLAINLPDGNLRRYCYFRNYSFILKNYYGFFVFLKWSFKYALYFLMKKELGEMRFFLQACFDGLNNDFTKHKIFIK